MFQLNRYLFILNAKVKRELLRMEAWNPQNNNNHTLISDLFSVERRMMLSLLLHSMEDCFLPIWDWNLYFHRKSVFDDNGRQELKVIALRENRVLLSSDYCVEVFSVLCIEESPVSGLFNELIQSFHLWEVLVAWSSELDVDWVKELIEAEAVARSNGVLFSMHLILRSEDVGELGWIHEDSGWSDC